MPRSITLGRTLLLSAIVACGIAAACCLAVLWITGIVVSTMIGARTYEYVLVGLDGEPVVVRNLRGETGQETVETLDGQPKSISSQQLLYPQWLTAALQSPSLGGPPWSTRIAAANDGGSPAVYWYLIHDGGTPPRAYGVGYHAKTKLPMGYFARTGFSQAQPPRDEWFVLNQSRSGLTGLVSTLGAWEPQMLTETTMPLLADGKLWLIDVAQRQVRELLDCPTASELGTVWILPGAPPVPEEGTVSQPANNSTPTQLLIRQPDSVIVFHKRTHQQSKYAVPADLSDKMIAAFQLADHRLLLIAAKVQADRQQEVIWLSPQDEPTTRRMVHLANPNTQSSLASIGWISSIAAPAPLASAVMAGIMSWQMGTLGELKTSAAGLQKWVAETWPSLLTVLAVGIAAAVAAYRRQRRFALPHAIPWAIFAFLFGIPGWFAYRFHRTWPVREECPSCRQPSPRDREACTECGADFPPPALKGTEVFA